MNLTISNSNIIKLKSFFTLLPDTFAHIPLKLGKDENGNCFAKVDATDINGDVSFFGRVELDDIPELQSNTMMVVRLQTNKAVLGVLFSPEHDSIQISKTRVLVETKKKKLSIQLYQMVDRDIYDLPESNVDMYDAVVENNPSVKDEGWLIVDIDREEMKDFVDSSNILSPNKNEDLRFDIKIKKDKLAIYSEDYIQNNFEYLFSPTLNKKINISTKYDYNLIDIMNKIIRTKDFHISTLISNPVISFTLNSIEEGTTATISVPAQRD